MTTPSDALYANQVYLTLIGDIETIWGEHTGSGISVGGHDDGVQATHPNLADNYNASSHVVDDNNNVVSGDPNLSANDRHGTVVAGIIAASSNSIGGTGIAYGTFITGVNIFDSSTYGYVNSAASSLHEFYHVVSQAGQIDIPSNSWGSPPVFNSNDTAFTTSRKHYNLIQEYETLSSTGRGGLGIIITQAAGNDTFDANGSMVNASLYTITVGATHPVTGFVADYSNYGASLLVSAPAANVTTGLLNDMDIGELILCAGFAQREFSIPVL